MREDSPQRHQNQLPDGLEAIEAQIRDEIAVMQGAMICDLRQDQRLVRLVAPEVCRVIGVRIGKPRVHAIAVGERAFDVGRDPPLAFEHN